MTGGIFFTVVGGGGLGVKELCYYNKQIQLIIYTINTFKETDM